MLFVKARIYLIRRDAKLVVLEWDNDRERLRSSSLHYFEGDAALRGGRTVFPYGPRAVADPLVCHLPGTLPANRIGRLRTSETFQQI